MQRSDRLPGGNDEPRREATASSADRPARHESGVTELWRYYEEDDLVRLVEERFQAAASACARSEANLISLHRALQDSSRSLTACRSAQEEVLGELRQMRILLRALTSQNAALERYCIFLTEERDNALKHSERVVVESDRMRRALVDEQDRFIQVLLEDHETALRNVSAERDAATRLAQSLAGQGEMSGQWPAVQNEARASSEWPERPTVPVPPREGDPPMLELQIPRSSKPPTFDEEVTPDAFPLDSVTSTIRGLARPRIGDLSSQDLDRVGEPFEGEAGATEGLHEAHTSPPPSFEQSEAVWEELMRSEGLATFGSVDGAGARASTLLSIPSPDDVESDDQAVADKVKLPS